MVNNAGVGAVGHFIESNGDDSIDMIDLNIKSVVGLTHLLAPHMTRPRERGRPQASRILMVGSVAGLAPGISSLSIQLTYVESQSRFPLLKVPMLQSTQLPKHFFHHFRLLFVENYYIKVLSFH